MGSAFDHSMRLRHFPVVARYAITTLLVLIAFGVRLYFWDQLPGYPYLLFFPVVILAAVLFDHGSGIWAALFSATLTLYFFIEPVESFAVASSHDLIAFFLYLVSTCAIAILIETMHRALADLHVANVELRRAHDELAAAHGEVGAAEQQKDILLQELTHRMKNDLMMVASLIQIQAKSVADLACRDVLASAVERIRVLGNVHSRLDRRAGAFVVDTREFLGGLCEDFRAAFLGARPIALLCEVESHAVSHLNAIALGLIANELITNSLKYAFPDERQGTVHLTFERKGDEYCLKVADDGIGVKEEAAASTGQRLVRSLTLQLRGRYEIAPGNPGTVCRVKFPVAEG